MTRLVRRILRLAVFFLGLAAAITGIEWLIEWAQEGEDDEPDEG